MSTRYVRYLILLSLFFIYSFPQAGVIRGRVFDSRGYPIVGATVMITGTSLGAMTGSAGEYLIEDIEKGVYSIQVGMVGMGQQTRDGIVVDEMHDTVVNIGEPNPEHMHRSVFDEECYCGRIIIPESEDSISDLPLQHTSARIVVCGNVQRVDVSQVYGNPFSSPIEAVYVFPLPHDGAVDRMNIYIGDRFVEGYVYESEKASEIYENAIATGHTAGLLTQERPNIFTQTLGNILPGDSITVEISYVAPLDLYENEFELVFPMVVGPRYIPGVPISDGERGWADPTDQVPDANRITPVVLPDGIRAGYDIDVEVVVNAGIPIYNLESVNHDIDWQMDDGVVTVTLQNENEIPNRDFVLRYSISADSREAGLIATNSELGGHFMLVIKPEAELDNNSPEPREYIFVVDCSGSMNGQPMAVAKETMRHFIRSMGNDDTFQIIKFSLHASSFAESPVECSRRNVNLGLAYVEMMSGSGGTEMINGVRAALGCPEDTDRNRYVIFLTDGLIGNEDRIFEEVRNLRGDYTMLWSVGVGSSPNRHLLDGLAEEGGGKSFYVALQEDPSEVASRVHSQINDLCIRNISIDWGDLHVMDIYPEEEPFLFAGEPLFIVGRYFGSGSDRIRITGQIGDETWSERLRVTLPFHEESNDVISAIWAREKIHHLERMMLDTADSETIEEYVSLITETALNYQLLSTYTSFVAVSHEVRTDEQGNTINVEVPVNIPEGILYEAVFGGLEPSSVGSTTITVTDSRGMIMQDATESFHVAARNETRTMPVAGGDEVAESTVETFVSRERTIVATLDSGASVTLLMTTASGPGIPYEQLNAILTRAIEQTSEVYEQFSSLAEGMIIFRIRFTAEGTVADVSVTQNFTGSQILAEKVISILKRIIIDSCPGQGVELEVAIEFLASS